MNRPLRVLIVEDSADDTMLLLRELERGDFAPTYRRVDNPSEMRDALAFGMWEVILADYTMPHFSGGSALAQARRSGLDLPFIIVSGSIGEDVAVAAMKAGAHDYIMKTNLGRLVPAVERELREAEIRRERKKADQRLAERVVEIEALNARLARQQEELATFNDLVTHDVSNFSMTLLGIVERLLARAEGPLTTGQEQLLRRANRQGLILSHLAENARRMAQLRRDGNSGERIPMRLSPMIRRAVETLRQMHFDRDFKVEVDCPDDMEVAGNSSLEIVFLVLLDTAVRQAPSDRTFELRIRAAAQGDALRVSVANGGRFDEEARLRLLERDPSAAPRTGAALGLTLAREIVETMGGCLEAPVPENGREGLPELVLSVPRK
jgi:K+-sensing histidine kinase KdpD